jgi:hypothetical protein
MALKDDGPKLTHSPGVGHSLSMGSVFLRHERYEKMSRFSRGLQIPTRDSAVIAKLATQTEPKELSDEDEEVVVHWFTTPGPKRELKTEIRWGGTGQRNGRSTQCWGTTALCSGVARG